MSRRREPGFCTACGSILPFLLDHGSVKCYSCKITCGPEAYLDDSTVTQYVVHFNTYTPKVRYGENDEFNDQGGQEEGPVVERKCPKCDNQTMSYATLQLRSADEGQTVFYTCTKCKYKETENS